MHELASASDMGEAPQIRTRRCPNCYLCGSFGTMLYRCLADRLFDSPGTWDLRICPNPECRLAWLDPMPTEEDIRKAYKTYYTHQEGQGRAGSLDLLLRRLLAFVRSAYLVERYGHGASRLPSVLRKLVALPLYFFRAQREAVDIPFAYLVRERGRLLDVGCGDGRVVKLAHELGWDAEGIEVDPKAAANARSKGLKVHLGELAAQDLADNSFDLILMNHVIEHVHDPRGLLRECKRLLRPTALLVVATPNIESWGHARFGRDWRGLEPPRHLHIFSASSLAGTAAAAGFGKVHISTMVRSAPFVFRISRSLRSMTTDVTRNVDESDGRLFGCVASFAEQMLLKSNPLLGEELLLEARK